MSIGYPPVNKCIYCGSTEEPLSAEHIIPYGLHGITKLPRASCAACADITKTFEGYCQRQMFGDFRNVLGLRTRRKKERPSHLTLRATFKDGSEGPLTIPVKEYPANLVLPVLLSPAGILRGTLPDESGQPILMGQWSWYETGKFEKIGEKYGATKLEALGETNTLKFVQLLAKIAHVATVRDYGVDGFAHLATPLILGKSKAVNHLVGCGGFPEVVPQENSMHGIGTFLLHTGVIVKLVRLFTGLGTGTPTYHVVTGLLPGGYIPKTS